ncbi:MAG TPA: thioredoxin domain-containing protein [Longimicrobiales bacterium]
MNKSRFALISLLLVGALSITAAVSYRSQLATEQTRAANLDTAARVVAEFLSLEPVALPSDLSPYWLARSTARFEDAPIHIVYYGDPLCSDCGAFFEQMKVLEAEFAGKMNIAYQFFPLEARCNNVVTKDKHPGACDLSYMMAARPDSFRALHDEILENMDSAKTAGWRTRFASAHGLEAALSDSAIQSRVHTLIQTGAEYPPTSPKFAHGIRSTPTLIVNRRMIIGTLPLPHMRAILQSLVFAAQAERSSFIESWINPGCSVESDAKQCGAQ